MVEGDAVFKEAIDYLKSLPPLEPLEWSDSLASSAMEHVTDIGPKGLLSYQSSDGTEPEDRIGKYGTFSTSLGENIDFGPNDALGVIVSMTLDDGEDQRPHRENLFKSDYHKIGIACGPHKTEFQMCVMDFAFDFTPINETKQKQNTNYTTPNNKIYNEPILNEVKNNDMKIKMKTEDILNNSNFVNNNNVNQSPFVKLSLERDDITRAKNEVINNQQNYNNYVNEKKYNETPVNNKPTVQNSGSNEIEELTMKTRNLMNSMKIVEKKVEVFTKVIYIYEDGSTREVSDTQTHTFNY